MKNKVYQFSKKEFKKAFELTEDLYCLCYILHDFCEHHSDDEETSNLIPFTKVLRKKADKLNYIFNEIGTTTTNDNKEEV